MLDAEPLKHYRLTQPMPLVINRDGRRYELRPGVYRASATCDPDGQVANLDHDPPLVRTSVIEHFADQFERVD